MFYTIKIDHYFDIWLKFTVNGDGARAPDDLNVGQCLGPKVVRMIFGCFQHFQIWRTRLLLCTTHQIRHELAKELQTFIKIHVSNGLWLDFTLINMLRVSNPVSINEGRVPLDCSRRRVHPVSAHNRHYYFHFDLVLFGEKWHDNLFLQSCQFIENKDSSVFFLFSKLFAFVSGLNQHSNISSAFTFALSLTLCHRVLHSPLRNSDGRQEFFFFVFLFYCCLERLRHGIGEQSYRITINSSSNWMFHLKSNNDIARAQQTVIMLCTTDDHRSDLCSLKWFWMCEWELKGIQHATVCIHLPSDLIAAVKEIRIFYKALKCHCCFVIVFWAGIFIRLLIRLPAICVLDDFYSRERVYSIKHINYMWNES